MEKTWSTMTADERQESLFKSWQSPQGATYVNALAEKGYLERTSRLKAAIQLKQLPDRVPVSIVGLFPGYLFGDDSAGRYVRLRQIAFRL